MRAGQDRRAEISDGSGPGRQDAVPRRVLIVDDSRLQRHILRRLLLGWGYVVDEAETGDAALALCRERPPDLVISDWMMPGMDGLGFCEAFRQLPREGYGYFILLTSKQEKLSVAMGLDAGADDFLTKPVSKSELRARLNAGERILEMSRQLRAQNRLLGQTLDRLQAAHDLIDGDLIEAKKLQQSLVRDRHRDFGGAAVSLLLRPAGRVGGDLVGFFPVNAQWFGCFALDVSGHGISSALMTARLAGYLTSATPGRNLAIQRDGAGQPAPRPPAEVARHLNQLVLGEMASEHYLTLVLAQVEIATGQVRLVQAGHPHPLIQRADGRIESVGRGGVPIGLLPGASYEEVRLRLEPGDRLLLQSDGITECPVRGDDGQEGGGLLDTEGLMALMAELRDSRGTAFLETLLWRLGEAAGGSDFPDDISAVLVEVPGA
ncbi:SpoIIE family protein phosphatase [Pseudooceanicola sp. CBS1P-1]|uniref:SpoIIE family protein phosphatase n=1 Tax=Pseudooceanicola albus TaxID=2692189 RepID=A0A6L7FZR7_9RHOB|nr:MULTISPECIES: SpoIIE family protein phosphatase [Pseudooceanicola]MBT9385692.1 SpoIIE family protein phosphatase [Pseudooceanicola endophyticus]MXN16726.1 SpoIIE family protein phosphatase [Pseudooceanicola albus]